MSFSGHNPHLFQWKKQRHKDKTFVKNDDIDHWRKRVEMASEFAVSEVFSHKKPGSGLHSRAISQHSSDQLRDHDDAYSEAQALLGDWLGSKLRLEMEMEDDNDLMCAAERTSSAAVARAHSPQLNDRNFNELYNHLAAEEEHSAVNGVLQDLMEHQVLDSVMVKELALDAQQTRKKYRNPMVTMEARHQQVRVNKAQREAVRLRQQREKEAQQEAREEARRQEREEVMKKNQEERRQEELLQQEMVRLRRQMKEKRGLEQLARQREKEQAASQRAAKTIHSALTPLKQEQPNQQLLLEQKCLQRHFSSWYLSVLDLRLRMGKAKALYDWRRMLRAWRTWRASVWMGQTQRELARTEEELRSENRQCQLAVESDRRRLLRRCLSQWHLWCRTEKEQRELLAQQQETKRKMAALISAASSGKLAATESPANQLIMVQSEAIRKPDSTEKKDLHLQIDSAPTTSTVHPNRPRPLQPWQVTRRDVAPTAAELHSAWHKVKAEGLPYPKISDLSGEGFKNRHAIQQQIITQQRKLLKDQQEQIARLKEERSVAGWEVEMKKTAPSVKQVLKQRSCSLDSMKRQRASGVTGEFDSQRAHSSKAATQHPIITAMEARARQRAERRKEIEELKRKKEEERLVEMKAAEERRLKQEEEEKLRAAEKRREEKRLEREREERMQRRLNRQRELTKVAHQHYHKTLLQQRGLVPWKRLLQLKCASFELAENHHRLSLLRRCTRGWQESVQESVSEKEASADQLYQHFLLQRSLKCWKRLKDLRLIQEERAKRFSRTHTLRRFMLALLDHVTQERLLEWDRQERANGHNNRRVLQRCFLAWRQLPSQLRIERQRNKRREKLSRKVAEVLPDFCSNNPS
ncbi:coiled-coil domain-containing protein 191 isoform X2 [Gouania willdenowi]|uniref:coiled-coil domain-containing protein 191 isoform X2 n=1 Tax=Gouania willdenowi TaxID=441366 RepID=UPI001055C9F2|nr:coiled-coil domain-containing protein 191 isoform X2 [Gouania willdenowi]